MDVGDDRIGDGTDDVPTPPPQMNERDGRTFRIPGPHERGRFTRDAWGHLLRLSGDTLNPAELEHVIERALTQLDGSIALDDLKALLEASGIDEPGTPGSRRTVH